MKKELFSLTLLVRYILPVEPILLTYILYTYIYMHYAFPLFLQPSSVRSLCKLCGWEAELEDMYKKSVVSERSNADSILKSSFQNTELCTGNNSIEDDFAMTNDALTGGSIVAANEKD